MITHLKGTLSKKSPTEIIVDVGGMGYSVNISLSTYEQLPEVNSSIHILTHHHVREDAQLLYGFFTQDEREIFRLLISVSGIGPKMAQTILSGIQPEELIRTISQGSIGSLTAIPGVGKKTAERMIVELRDKVTKMGTGIPVSGALPNSASIRGEAFAALPSLGFTREKAEQSLRSVLNESDGSDLVVEEMIKKALKVSGK